MKRIAIALICLFAISADAATFTVINTNDTGAGSLRAAISNANANAGSHLIDFAIPSAGVQTINPATSLPSLSKSVTIDGYTQSGASANTLSNDDNAVLLIELNGTGAGGNGLNISVTNCVIRGLVINRFVVNGISTDNSRDNVIEGNFIGTDPTGTIKRPNAQGVLIGGQNALVGGTTPAARNLISGNTGQGLSTSGTATTNIVIRGNFIGTDVHGTTVLGNGSAGVSTASATKNTVGGTAPGAGNVISGNGGNGITLVTSNNAVQGNWIGTDITGTLNLSNHLDGVALSSARDNTIGGAVGNVIAFNSGAGISVSATVPNNTNNLISANTIFSNGALGINLIANSDPVSGVTSNDATDADTGANRLQNFPVLSVATNVPSGLQIQGFLNSTASTTFTLEFFANTSCDPSGFGEGEEFIGATNVTTAANGTNNFTVVFTNTVPDGEFITATATDPDNNTSEFSACRQIAGAAPTVVACSLLPALATNTVSTAHTVTATVTTNSNPAGGVLVNFNVTAGPNVGQAGTATTSVSGQGSFTYTGSATPGADTIRAISSVAGSASTCTATKVWISADAPPEITCPANITTNTAAGNCARSVGFIATATGAPTPTITYWTNGLAVTSPASFPKGVTTVTAKASNTVSTAMCTFTVTVNDNVLPIATCPGNITSNVAAGVTSSVVDYTLSGTDNCPGVSVTGNPLSGSTFGLGTTPVTVTAVDGAANTNTCTFNVTVQAAVPCTITCPSDIVSNTAPGLCGATVSFSVGSSGTCPTVTATPPSGSFFDKGTTPVTVTTNGATACTFNVTVNDTQKPTLACHGNITTNVAVGITNAVVNYTVTVSDNCAVASTNIFPASGTTFPLGTTPVVILATDTSGNTSTCSFNVVVSALPPEKHDLAVVSLKAPKNINLKAAAPALTKFASVSIVNLSDHDEMLTTYSNLVTLVAETLGTNCPNATVVLHAGPPNKALPFTLRSKKKLTVRFDVTYDCANDPAKGAGHQDFRFVATVNHTAIDGNADTMPVNDVCPRDPSGSDKGCGGKNPNKTRGGDVLTDVVFK